MDPKQVAAAEHLVHVIRRRGGPRAPGHRKVFARAAEQVAEARQRIEIGCGDSIGIPPLVWAIGVLMMLAGPAKCVYDVAQDSQEVTKTAVNWLAVVAVVGAAAWVAIKLKSA